MKIAYTYQCGDCLKTDMTATYKGERFWCSCQGLVSHYSTALIPDFLADHLSGQKS